MAGPFLTKAIDNAGPYNVVAQTTCNRIVVQENYNSANPPTADLQQFNPDGTGPIAIAKGTPAVFGAPDASHGGRFQAGQIVGKINTTAGSITVQQSEADLI